MVFMVITDYLSDIAISLCEFASSPLRPPPPPIAPLPRPIAAYSENFPPKSESSLPEASQRVQGNTSLETGEQ
jgi:hypothetical protein